VEKILEEEKKENARPGRRKVIDFSSNGKGVSAASTKRENPH